MTTIYVYDVMGRLVAEYNDGQQQAVGGMKQHARGGRLNHRHCVHDSLSPNAMPVIDLACVTFHPA